MHTSSGDRALQTMSLIFTRDEQTRKGILDAMANDRAITAESVATVLESARAQRQSGRLLVGQFAGGRFQEGEIYLQGGQPVYARLGTLVGQDALNRLVSWRNVQFSLILDEASKVSTQPAPAVDTGSKVPSLPPSPRQSAEFSPTSPLPKQQRNEPRSPGLEWLIPQKRQFERDVLSLPLTRPQRFVYFLVDGKRTVADISRCTGKTVQELDLILGALQAQGLIVI